MTLASLFAAAADPQRVFAGVCEQRLLPAGSAEDCSPERLPAQFQANVGILLWHSANGASLLRQQHQSKRWLSHRAWASRSAATCGGVQHMLPPSSAEDYVPFETIASKALFEGMPAALEARSPSLKSSLLPRLICHAVCAGADTPHECHGCAGPDTGSRSGFQPVQRRDLLAADRWPQQVLLQCA